MKPDHAKLPVINGLRGLAILAVVFWHIVSPYTFKHLHTLVLWHGVTANIFVLPGWIGVNLFFILSGFVLYLPYFLGKRQMDGLPSAMLFYKHRAARLGPLFWINCLVCALIAFGSNPHWLKSTLLAITTLSVFSPSEHLPGINIVLWSLHVEIYFSLLFPLLILLLKRFGWTKTALGVFVGCFLLRNISLQHGWVLFPNSILGRLDDFVLGMLLCKIYMEDRRLNLNAAWLTFAGFAGLEAAFAITAWFNQTHPGVHAIFPASFILQLCFFTLILGALRSTGMLYCLFTNRWLQLCGLMSYSIYIWHYIMKAIFFHLATTQSEGYALFIYFLLLIPLVILSYRYIEFGKEPNWRRLFLLEGK